MSDHADWRASKFDMGPLWPRKLANAAAFEHYPIEEYSFMEEFVTAEGADDIADLSELDCAILYAEDPDQKIPYNDRDTSIDTTTEVQEALIKIYGVPILPKYGVDGDLGAETIAAVTHFQQDWNRRNREDLIDVDGIPGVQTMEKLERVLQDA